MPRITNGSIRRAKVVRHRHYNVEMLHASVNHQSRRDEGDLGVADSTARTRMLVRTSCLLRLTPPTPTVATNIRPRKVKGDQGRVVNPT